MGSEVLFPVNQAPAQLCPLECLEEGVPARDLCAIGMNGTLESTLVISVHGGMWISPLLPDGPGERKCVDVNSAGRGVEERAVGVKQAANIKEIDAV